MEKTTKPKKPEIIKFELLNSENRIVKLLYSNGEHVSITATGNPQVKQHITIFGDDPNPRTTHRVARASENWILATDPSGLEPNLFPFLGNTNQTLQQYEMLRHKRKRIERNGWYVAGLIIDRFFSKHIPTATVDIEDCESNRLPLPNVLIPEKGQVYYEEKLRSITYSKSADGYPTIKLNNDANLFDWGNICITDDVIELLCCLEANILSGKAKLTTKKDVTKINIE